MRKILRHRQEIRQVPTAPLHAETEGEQPKTVTRPIFVFLYKTYQETAGTPEVTKLKIEPCRH